MARILFALLTLVAMAGRSLQAVPAPPTALAGTVTGSTVTLAWTAPPGLTLLGYRLEAGSVPGASDIASTVVGTTPGFTATSVPPGTYFVRIRAIAADGESDPSNEATIVVGGSTCVTVPGPPVGFTSTVNNQTRQVVLTWTPPQGACSPSAYVIEAGSSPAITDLASLQVAANAYSVIAPIGTYYVRVRGVNNFGVGTPSSELIIAVGGPTAAAQVTINQATAAIAQDTSGNAIIIGEVTNQSTVPATFIEVSVALRNASGGTIGTDATFVRGRPRRIASTGSVDDSALAPGEIGCFYLITNVPRLQVAGLSLGLTHESFASTSLGTAVDTTSVVAQSSGGNFGLAGTARNNGGVVAYFSNPVFYMQRSDGVAIGCDYTFVRGSFLALPSGVTTDTALAPGQSGTFGFLTHASNNVQSLRSWTQFRTPNASDPLGALADQTYDLMSRAGDSESGKREAIAAWEALQTQRRALARQAGQ